MTVSEPISLWDRSAAETAAYRPLEGDAETDLAIVGGGFTGLSTALHAAERGIACRVLEARIFGFGGSGRNVGLVNAGLWVHPDEAVRRLGAAGETLVAALGAAPAYVFSLIERFAIACEPRRAGTIHAAHSARGFEDLRARWRQWQARGAPVDLLDAGETARRVGSDAYRGGLHDRRAGTINPMGYARGLARAAASFGAAIHTDTPVLSLVRDGSRWTLHTPRGTVRARAVVLGTNALSDGLWPGLAASYTRMRYFQVASEPLGERAAHILPGGEGLWDTAPVMSSLRRDAAGRLIVGSMGQVIGGEAGLSRRWAARHLRRLFPAFGPVRFEEAWHGEIDMTPDNMPRLHRLADDLYTAIGYNGRGITPGTIFGRALARLVAGDGEETLPVPLSDPKPVVGRHVMAGFYTSAFAAHQLLRSL